MVIKEQVSEANIDELITKLSHFGVSTCIIYMYHLQVSSCNANTRDSCHNIVSKKK